MAKKRKRTTTKWSRNQKILLLGTIIIPSLVILGGIWKYFTPAPPYQDLEKSIRDLEEKIQAIMPPVKTIEDAGRPLKPYDIGHFGLLVTQLEEKKQQLREEFKREFQISVGTWLSYGCALIRQDQYKEAERLYRAILARYPDNTDLISGLGIILYCLARYEEAEPLFLRAMEINEASYGKNHPKVATDLNNLASLFTATNRLKETVPLYRRALEILIKSQGPEHPDTLTIKDNLEALGKR